MSSEAVSTVLDITPHPRILSILKDIEFTMLQCFCELIDNSIDGFLDALRAGKPIEDPTINVGIGRDTITLFDNGPGMSLDRLESAVKAGWTSKDGSTSLGLYGMGFNIATAKLGGITTIWTTRVGDKEWEGIQIDLAVLAGGTTFKLPLRRRRKDDPNHSGTEIEITKLKPEWVNKLSGQALKNNITNPLGRVYKSMLRDVNPHPIHFKLRVNGVNIPAWEHCVWPETKTVTMKSTGEIIRAIESFDRVFNTRYRSISTGEIHDSPDGHDPADLVEIQERVHGWVGIQRYTDPNDYGIDIIRNGRVIEMASKDLFSWVKEDGTKRKEYPIDDQRERGRIVGEIHLDHGYVFYTKKNFEHDHYSWHQLMQTVLNNEPLTHRSDKKTPNMSPLGKIFRAFRRNSPQRPQTYTDILAIKDYEKAKKGAEAYRKGDALYRNIKWWEEQLSLSDQEDAPKPSEERPLDLFKKGKLGATTPEASDGGGDGVPADAVDNPPPPLQGPGKGATSPTTVDKPTPPPLEVKRTALPDQELRMNGPLSDRAYRAMVYRIDPAPSDLVLQGKHSAAGGFEIEVNPDHPVFQSSTFQLRDGVLAEFAHHVTEEENARGANTLLSFSTTLAVLREQYRSDNSLDANRLALDLGGLVTRLQAHLTSQLDEARQDDLLALLTEDSRRRIKLAQARSQSGIRKGAAALLDIHDLALIFSQRPELLMEVGCFRLDWTPAELIMDPVLLEEHRADVRQRIGGVLASLSGFAPRLDSPGTQASLFYVRAGLGVLEELLT